MRYSALLSKNAVSAKVEIVYFLSDPKIGDMAIIFNIFVMFLKIHCI
jgi:hypothetical protein